MISYCKKQSNFQTFKTKSGDYYEERKILEACDSSLYVSSVTVIVYFTSSYYVDLFGLVAWESKSLPTQECQFCIKSW